MATLNNSTTASTISDSSIEAHLDKFYVDSDDVDSRHADGYELNEDSAPVDSQTYQLVQVISDLQTQINNLKADIDNMHAWSKAAFCNQSRDSDDIQMGNIVFDDRNRNLKIYDPKSRKYYTVSATVSDR